MSSIGSIYIGRQAKRLDIAPQFDGYSKVILNVTEELYYEAGTSTGRTLTLTCPWGTQAMCDNILASIQGYQYQPLDAQDAILDPAAELGDGVTIKDTYSLIASMSTTFGPLLRADLSAPGEEEIDHEYPYKSPQERKVTRQFANVRSSLKINADLIAAEVEQRKDDIQRVNAQLSVQAGQIAAKVSKTGGDASSFGWEMTDAYMVWKANNREIFRLDSTGAKVTGEINATTGKIGGLTIKNNALSYNQDWNGANSNGLYVGPNGIQLGKNFKVDSSGKLTAASGTFTGSVNAGNIRYGGSYGTFSGGGISGGSIAGNRLMANTVSTVYTSGGINASLGYANFSNDVFNNNDTADWLKVSKGLKLGGYWLGLTSRTIEGQLVRYVTWHS